MKRNVLFMAAVTLMLAGCTDPREDFNIHITPTFYKYVVEVELQDLKTPDDVFTGDVKVQITGPDAGKIYTLDGKRIPPEGVSPDFGSVQLITSRASEPKAGQPLRFNVEVASGTYRGESIEVEVEEEDYYVNRNISLLNLSNLPSGINTSGRSGNLNSSGELQETLLFTTDSTNGNTSQLKMTIPTGIKFMDANGAVLSGNELRVDVLNFTDTSFASQIALPNGSGAVQKVKINGQTENLLLTHGATFDINMRIGNQEVRKFSGNGIELNIPLPDHMYNQVANRPYQAGDQVSLLSFTKGNTAWEDEGTYTVVMEGGKLRVKPSVNHLTTFKLIDNLGNVSLNKQTIFEFTNNSDQEINKNLYLGFEIGSSRFALRYGLKLKRGQKQTFEFSFSGDLHSLKLYFPEKFPDFDASIASDKVAFTFKSPESAVEVGYKLYCTSSETFVTPPAGVKMFYRKTSEGGKFKHLNTFTGEDLSNKLHKLKQLQAGEFYDFKAYYGEHEVDTANVQVVNKKIYQVNLPAEVCEVIGF